ncbi:hypothetical protein NG798_20635 [Ancylothrix sp. C2]|uniref:hypothetical protein n=1 Tax=Ancylothrix sp. D3o TaxID=2953691 RepID=UPI0021BA68B1|nr:hypothetical protein [Ancylothrix sp. D3o]MCT7952208.1 hypothetical protein [Ancylothrix sp. D3o]
METPTEKTFITEHTAKTIEIHDPNNLNTALTKLGLKPSKPVLVLVGGAKGISETDMERLRSQFVEVIAPIVEAQKATIIDGGTDAGVMQLIGYARAQNSATFPLIGIAPAAKVALQPGQPGTPLEPHHTHFLLVPGTHYGDESPYIARVASLLASSSPSLTLVVNGGEITYKDVTESLNVGRPVITLDGTGRTADQLAAALRGEDTDIRAKNLVKTGNIKSINLLDGSASLAATLQKMLSS